MEPKLGDLVHFEINASDPQRAKKFYSNLFGWKFQDSNIPGVEYYVIDGATPGGAINPNTDPSSAKKPTVYFNTNDIDATLKKIRDGGGTAENKQPIPGQGWFAACTDTEGNSFSLFQNDPSVSMETMAQFQESHR
ncbi:MAG TPA: VOC family protein [Candidatus Limnocylindria bacterium]|nr:VOC family protein [Candidatus Limnocylindria bacterium]